MGLRLAGRRLLVLVTVLGLPSCDYDRAAIAPANAAVVAVPEFVCPGEVVTVSWDAGEQTDSPACSPGGISGRGPSRSDCILVDRTSTPAHPSWDETGDLDTQDERRLSVDVTTTFTATARMGVGEGSESVTVTVIEEAGPGPTEQPFEFEGICDGARATWAGVALKDRTSGCLEVMSICNTESDPVRLTDVADPSHTDVVEPGRCTREFNGRAPNLTGAFEGYAAPVGTCGAERTTGGPPSIRISVLLQCNRDMPTCAF